MHGFGFLGGALIVGALSAGFASHAEARGGAAREPATGDAGKVAVAKVEADGYVAELVVGSDYKAGAKSTYVVTLKARNGFHVNAQFPVRFKADASDDVAYTKSVLKREDGTFNEAEGTFTVEFVASKTGAHPVGGTLSLSVCNDANCLMEKVALSSSIDVK